MDTIEVAIQNNERYNQVHNIIFRILVKNIMLYLTYCAARIFLKTRDTHKLEKSNNCNIKLILICIRNV